MKERKKGKSNNSNKGRMKNLARRILPQLLAQSLALVITALASLMLMTWIIRDLAGIKHIYAAAGFEVLGMIGFFILVLVPLIIILYRKRAKEVLVLSEAIQKVAAGDYATRITNQKKGQITPIYEDFNKMCGELESVKLLRNDFINSYSHEFKTPIASINGFASLLLEKKLPDEEREQYLRIIVDESARLSNLATNTILLSKLSSQEIVTDLERYNLGEQLRECSIILSGKWLKKKINFEADISDIMYRGNKEMMQHLWINLLDNAVKYTDEGGTVSVSVYEDSGRAIVKIADTGQGIGEDIRDSLFNPYFQGDTSHSGQGLGLGLAIVRRIVELSRGEIFLDSRLKSGSVFTVSLPLN